MNSLKLRSFYVKYIYCCFALNPRRYLMKVSDTELCTFCNTVKETRVHLFWECNKVAPAWHTLIQFCKTHVDKNADYCRNNCLLLGFEKPILNYIMTKFKYHIYSAKLFQFPIDINRVLRSVKGDRIMEDIVVNMAIGWTRPKFHKNWGPLLQSDPFTPFVQ